MTGEQTAVVILAAGLGTRMKSSVAKVMHPLAGRPMIRHLLNAVEQLAPQTCCVVIGAEMEAVARAVAPHPTVVQTERLGTGHAVLAAEPALAGFAGDVLIVYGDTPLISPATMQRMLEVKHAHPRPAVVVLGFRPNDPGAYGRLIVDGSGRLQAIVEAKDASPEQLQIGLCNAGMMVVDGTKLFGLLRAIGTVNAKGEYYLTDVVTLAQAQGLACRVAEGCERELIGINSRADLARAEAFLQETLRGRAMRDGATLIDPSTVYFSADTQVGRDVTIGPSVFFGPGVTVGDRVEIRAFCHIEGAVIEAGAIVGPFSRLRPGAVVAEGAHVGNFVEIKNATVEEGAKVNHLTYIGDARIGAKANVGAGTITCNYDGYTKGFTDIGEGAFIGSNSSLVAPVKIGAGAIIGAGSVITRDVEADALALTRGPHLQRKGWGRAFRTRKDEEKRKKQADKGDR
ncbi:MAG: bifunctional UDP-N-acetylglucosamine diphosphorylase/glucosamine-1-phosphate N-acetyltransferase GlmU [Defluviicoccus sp.]